MAMALGSQLGNFLQQVLQHLTIVLEKTRWSFSQVCLACFKTTKTLEPSARTRVSMINSYKCSFFFILTDLNPANIATRISPDNNFGGTAHHIGP